MLRKTAVNADRSVKQNVGLIKAAVFDERRVPQRRKIVPIRTIKACGGSIGIAPFIVNRRTR